MGTYTPNYNLYMPSIGEQGWGELVSNNFEILDTNLNDLQTQITTNLNNLQDQIDVIDTNIGNGTRTLTLTGSASSTPNFQQYWDGRVYVTYINGNHTLTTNIKPPSSAQMCLLICTGNLTISTNLDTYPTSLRSETPPNSTSNNVYSKIISTSYSDTITLPYTKSNNSAVIEFSKSDLKSFLDAVNYTSVNYTVSIPAATAAGGSEGNNGTAGSASNTCNGGGGYGIYYGGNYDYYTGGTGCIFGQYAGGSGRQNGYGYGSNASNKYRCGLIIFVVGNLIINNTITQNGGDGSSSGGSNIRYTCYSGYGGGAGGGQNSSNYSSRGKSGGGGGAPVFIYYTGTYTNNGTINTAGGNPTYSSDYAGYGGAGGIKTTKITL